MWPVYSQSMTAHFRKPPEPCNPPAPPSLLSTAFVAGESQAVIVNDDQEDATILAYLFIPNQLYMFRAMSSPIIRST